MADSISDYININLIVSELGVTTKEEAIGVLLDKIYQGEPESAQKTSRQEAYQAIMAREKMQSTGIGSRVAFPHARIPGWGRLAIALGMQGKGIDFNSVDKLPVKLVCVMISSPDEPYTILQAMATIIRCLKKDIESGQIFEKPLTAAQIMEKFSTTQISTAKYILARDIVRPVKASVTLDTSIEEATRIMHLKQLDILPVVDKENKFCGEISCLEVFEYGMPNFFKQLKTISFVRHIDPFEKYFRIKRDLKVKDFVIRDIAPFSMDKTLLEIIFEMTVKKRSELFIVDENRSLIGAIDRFCIIDKILFF